MKVIIAGSTGMIGQLILDSCLRSDKVTEVVSLVRKPTGRDVDKLSEIVIQDFGDYSTHAALFQGVNQAFFCIGVYTGQVPDELFKTITV
ncbi:MAG: NmrA family NAD(P)-binding protein, partial [Bacteroidota bacterium]